MPTVAGEGHLKFIINTRENEFEPPHVHVWISNEDLCRIELNGTIFMEEPPTGMKRHILEAYFRNAENIRKEWDRIHQR